MRGMGGGSGERFQHGEHANMESHSDGKFCKRMKAL
jgi:hypothetical protein